MNVSEAFSAIMKIRRVAVIVSILAGAGYKTAPMVMHQVEGHSAKTASHSAAVPSVVTNADGVKISTCDLGAVSLTNHLDTCVSLGGNRDCLVTPVVIDKNSVQLTVQVESKNANGRVHDFAVTQVVAKPGKAVEVAVGDYSFSLTPTLAAE
jgi:hypothetical protein